MVHKDRSALLRGEWFIRTLVHSREVSVHKDPNAVLRGEWFIRTVVHC